MNKQKGKKRFHKKQRRLLNLNLRENVSIVIKMSTRKGIVRSTLMNGKKRKNKVN